MKSGLLPLTLEQAPASTLTHNFCCETLSQARRYMATPQACRRWVTAFQLPFLSLCK